MDHEKQLKLQAFLDGELAEVEAREVANLVACEQAAAALAGELRTTRQLLARFERVTPVPESREFYWSKIRREIERHELQVPAGPRTSWLAGLRKLLVPLSTAAVFLVTALALLNNESSGGDSTGELEVTSQHMGAQTFRSQTEGMKMVWLYDRETSQFTDDASPDKVDSE